MKPNPFNTPCFLKVSFTCRIRRLYAMSFFGKIDDITTSITPRSMQDLRMLIMYLVRVFSVSSIFRLIIYIIRTDMQQNDIRLMFVKSWSDIMIQSLRCSAWKNIKVCFSPVTRFLKEFPFYSIQVALTDDTNFLSKLVCFRICSPTRYYT